MNNVFHLMVRKNVRAVLSENSITRNISEEELAQQIRTNFVVYTQYSPSYTTIADKVKDHVKTCPTSKHYFFEVEPVCTKISATKDEILGMNSDIFNVLQFMKYVTRVGKELFLDNHLCGFLSIDTESLRFYLEPPHFEVNLERLMDSVIETEFAKRISLKNYKTALEHHIASCSGPCKLNSFGFPVCGKNEKEIESLEKMFAGFYLIIKSKCNKIDQQYLFDMIYKTGQYQIFIKFVSVMFTSNEDFREKINNVKI